MVMNNLLSCLVSVFCYLVIFLFHILYLIFVCVNIWNPLWSCLNPLMVLSFGILFIWKLHQIHFVFLLIVLGY